MLMRGDMEIDLAKARVNEKCVGCGACAVVCPVSAMQLRHYKDDQLVPKIKVILTPKWLSEEKKDEPVIVAFACQ
jgi:Fe-S-cluster-containing hydrogenase component 2